MHLAVLERIGTEALPEHTRGILIVEIVGVTSPYHLDGCGSNGHEQSQIEPEILIVQKLLHHICLYFGCKGTTFFSRRTQRTRIIYFFVYFVSFVNIFL